MSLTEGKGKKCALRRGGLRIHGLPRRTRWRKYALILLSTALLGTFFFALRIAAWGRSSSPFSILERISPPRLVNRFSIGAFLHSLHPSNTSFCAFPLGFAENFSLPEELIMGSPELGDKGPYRIIYNIVQGRAMESELIGKAVTFVTHSTLEYIVHIAEMARSWDGPVSVACYLPSWDFARALVVLKTLCMCEPAMQNVSIHAVFHMEHPPNTTDINGNATIESCNVPNSLISPTERENLRLPYPVNVARNVARQGAKTELLLVADIELFPSAGLASGFLDMLERLPRRRTGDHSFIKKRHVFVVPVFEVAADVRRLPRTKKELLSLYNHDRAVYFHKHVCVHCQRFPGLQQWLQRREPPRGRSQAVQPLLVVKREFPHHRWEPIYIGTHREPLYSELLIWEGQQDKMAQMYEMCLLDYRFVILDGVFLVHAPGIKVKKDADKEKEGKFQGNTTISTTSSERRVQHVQRNAYLYRIITQDLQDKYGENPRCRRF